MNIQTMIAVVQAYIHLRKNVEVQINTEQFRDPVKVFMLNSAYQEANSWFQDNKGKIEMIK